MGSGSHLPEAVGVVAEDGGGPTTGCWATERRLKSREVSMRRRMKECLKGPKGASVGSAIHAWKGLGLGVGVEIGVGVRL